jgi:hypothetical protein
MRDALIAVTTTARPGVDYLPATIASLEANGALEARYRFIHSDGPLEGRERFGNWNVTFTENIVGSRRSFWNTIQLANNLGVELLGFEDDIAVCKNAVTKMLALEVPSELAWVSFFDNMVEEAQGPGIKICSLGERLFWGVQAVKIPKWSFPDLLKDGVDLSKIPEGYLGGRDYAMQKHMYDSNWPMYGSFFPNLVQHVGDVSVLNGMRARMYDAMKKRRISYNYPGDDFDALTV